MISSTVLFCLLPLLAQQTQASPFFNKRIVNATATVASAFAGSTTSDVFPPASTTVNPSIFPSEPVIGFPGVTMTGEEPDAIQTGAVYAYNNEGAAYYPLAVDQPLNASSSDDITRQWGNLSPWFSVNSSVYGLPSASPLTPETCSITQVHLLYRHGARYPTSGALPSTFAAQLQNATKNGGGGFNATGDLKFLNTWTYKLGSELLTPFGRLQNFELGVSMRQQYGYLLNNFTQQGTLPVFRTESQDRMVKTAENFAAGFFGVPEYLSEVNIEIVVEASGYNNSGAPYEVCTNANVASKGSIGSTVATAWSNYAFNSTISRIQSQIKGINVTGSTIISMLQLCSYETDALGYSSFCKLFTAQDFANYEYYYDLSFYYNNGYGSPVSAAQGKGYLEEFVSRFTHTPLTAANSTQAALNYTLDSFNVTFPLNQSIYADATHEVVVLDTLTAFNLSAIFQGGPLPTTYIPDGKHYTASNTVPFATHFHVQIMECSSMTPTKQMRFILNDAVLPLNGTYPGCAYNKDGLCAFDTVISALKTRISQIDYNHACFGNYTAQPGMNYQGLAPSS